MTVTIVFALAAALANAIHLMTQHTASVGVSKPAPQLGSGHLPDPSAPLAAGLGRRSGRICLPGDRTARRTALGGPVPPRHRVGLCLGPAQVLDPPAHRQDGLDCRACHLWSSGGVPHRRRAPWRPLAAGCVRLGHRTGGLRRGRRRVGRRRPLGISCPTRRALCHRRLHLMGPDGCLHQRDHQHAGGIGRRRPAEALAALRLDCHVRSSVRCSNRRPCRSAR